MSAARRRIGDAAPVDRVGGDVLADVVVRWMPSTTATTDALRALGADAAGHVCPRCGGGDHGMPWARAGDVRLAASASRSGEHLVVVTRPASLGAIGVDVEALDAHVDADVVLHPDERGAWAAHAATDPAGAAASLLRTWAAKEAIVKHLGTGLRTDPAAIRVVDFAVHRIPAPPGLTAAICTGRADAPRSSDL